MKTTLCAALLAASCGPAAAVDLAWSGFATLGFARSDAPYTYQRSIDRNGTFDRDSVLAGQLDMRLTPQWSATVQAKAAPALRADHRWDLTASWAFVAWRPNDDWLLRAGRLRVPLFLYSETQDVGAANDMARTPNEMNAITPTPDFTGLYATRNWTLGEREVTVDGYTGYANMAYRQWSRESLGPGLSAGARFTDVRVRSTGLVLTVRGPDALWRAGIHKTNTRLASGQPMTVRFPRVDLAPGVGYWQVDDALPGPGVVRIPSIENLLFTFGAELQLGNGWRVAGELGRARQFDTELGADATAGYLALFKSIDRFTPYISVSRMLSSRSQREWYDRLSKATMPSFVPGAAQIVGAQRAAADLQTVFDQHSVGLGMSYRLDASSKLKAEWMRTSIGKTSSMVDVPPGGASPSGTHVNVISINYSVAF